MRPHSSLVLALLVIVMAVAGGTVPRDASAGATPVAAATVEVVSRFPIDGEPGAIAVAPDGVWVTTGLRSVVKLDPDSGEVLATVLLPGQPRELAIGGRALWVYSGDGGGMQEVPPPPEAGADAELHVAVAAVHRIDLESGEHVATIPVGPDGGGLAVGHGAIWVGIDGWEDEPGALMRIDPATNAIATMIPLAGAGQRMTSVAPGPDGVWAVAASESRPGTSRLHLIDPATNAIIRSVDLGGLAPVGLVAVTGAAWLTGLDLFATPVGSTLSRIDASTGDVTTIATPGLSFGIAAGADRLWLSDGQGAMVTPLDPVTGQAVAEPALVGEPAPDGFDPGTDSWDLLSRLGAPVVHGDDVWVAVPGDGAIVRLRMLP